MEQVPDQPTFEKELSFENEDMKMEYVDLPMNGTKAIEIDNPDEKMYKIVQGIMLDNLTGSEAYNVTKSCGAFWQVGHDFDDGYIQLEFWKPDVEAHKALFSLIKERYFKAQ